MVVYFSATVPLDIVGVWTIEERREQEPGLHLVHQLWTATDQVRSATLLVSQILSELRICASLFNIETTCRVKAGLILISGVCSQSDNKTAQNSLAHTPLMSTNYTLVFAQIRET